MGFEVKVACEVFAVTLQTSGVSFHLDLQFLLLSYTRMAVPSARAPLPLVISGAAGRNQPACCLGIFHEFHLNSSDENK